MTPNEKLVSVKRQDLENLIFKRRGSHISFAFIKYLIFVSGLIGLLVLIIAFLPQHWFEGLSHTLQASSRTLHSGLQPDKLGLTDLKEEWVGDSFIVSGTVRNLSNDWIQGLVVVLKLYGRQGIINTLFADLYDPVVPPGKVGSFRVAYSYPEDKEPLDHLQLYFQLKDGSLIPHKDSRAQ